MAQIFPIKCYLILSDGENKADFNKLLPSNQYKEIDLLKNVFQTTPLLWGFEVYQAY